MHVNLSKSIVVKILFPILNPNMTCKSRIFLDSTCTFALHFPSRRLWSFSQKSSTERRRSCTRLQEIRGVVLEGSPSKRIYSSLISQFYLEQYQLFSFTFITS